MHNDGLRVCELKGWKTPEAITTQRVALHSDFLGEKLQAAGVFAASCLHKMWLYAGVDKSVDLLARSVNLSRTGAAKNLVAPANTINGDACNSSQ